MQNPSFQSKDFSHPTEVQNKTQLCNIDLLRGIAAIAILFWHYQHFYFQGTVGPTFELLKQQEPCKLVSKIVL